MIESKSEEYIEKLQSKLARSIPLPDKSDSFALLDFPNIKNVGDSAIWLGEITHFNKHCGRLPSYISSMPDFSETELQRVVPSGPIYLRGGGNFGDLWPGHQTFRERMLERFPTRSIVQLPQSLQFNSQAALERAKRAIGNHSNFILLVRDNRSLEFAQAEFECEARLVPDMAFAIGPIKSRHKPLMPILGMLRHDREQARLTASSEGSLAGIPLDDWITEPRLPIKFAKALGLLRGSASLSRNAARRGKYEAAARHRFERGIYQLSRAETVITDRLHVHILSILLGKVHGVLDNSYGKIANFRAAFPEPEGLTFSFTDLGEAVAWAKARTIALERPTGPVI